MYLLLPFVHEAVEEKPEEFLPVLCGVEAPVLGLFLVKADAGLVLDVASNVNLVLSHILVNNFRSEQFDDIKRSLPSFVVSLK